MAASQNEAHPIKGNVDNAAPTLHPPSYTVACTAFNTHLNPGEACPCPPYPPNPPPAYQATPQPPGQKYCVQQTGISHGYPVAAPYGNAEVQRAGVGAHPAAAAAAAAAATGGTSVVVRGGSNVSMVDTMVLSCVVFWFFFGVFGGIAFILALFGQYANTSGDRRRAIQWRNASYGVSAAGLIIGGVVIAGIIIGLSTTARQDSYYTSCYRPTSYYSYYRPYQTYRTYYYRVKVG